MPASSSSKHALSRIGTVLAAATLSFFAGRCGLPVLFPLLIAAAAASAETARADRARRADVRQQIQRLLHERGGIGGGSRSSSSANRASTNETVRWLNEALLAFFPQISAFGSDKISDAAKDAITRILADSKPPAVQSMKVKKVSLGGSPPLLHDAKFFTAKSTSSSDSSSEHSGSRDLWQWDVSMAWRSDFEMTMALKLGVTRTLAIPLKIEASDLEIRGRLRLRARFKGGQPPFLDSVSVSFKEDPDVSIAVSPMPGTDVAHMPMLQNWIWDSVTTTIRDLMVLPDRLEIKMGGVDSAAAAAAGSESGEGGSVGGQDSAQSAVDATKNFSARPRTSFTANVTGALAGAIGKKKTGKHQPVGLLTVNLRRAKNVIGVDTDGLSDPFVKLSVGRATKRSQVQKNTVNPEWSEDFSFPVMRSAPPVLNVRVYDWNAVASEVFLGKTSVDFRSDMETPGVRRDVNYPLTADSGELDQPRGTIQLAVHYTAYEAYEVDSPALGSAVASSEPAGAAAAATQPSAKGAGGAGVVKSSMHNLSDKSSKLLHGVAHKFGRHKDAKDSDHPPDSSEKASHQGKKHKRDSSVSEQHHADQSSE